MNCFQEQAVHRAKSSHVVHADLCIIGKVKLEAIKKMFVISAISALIILSVGGYLNGIYSTSLIFKITYSISSSIALIMLIESVYVLAKAYDILPSCMYGDQ